MWALEQVLGKGVWPFVDAEQHITGLGRIDLSLANPLFHTEEVSFRIEFDQAIKAQPVEMAFRGEP